MKPTTIISICVLTLALVCGCDSIINHFDGKAQYYAHKVIIHDTDYDTYFTTSGEWSDDKSKAKEWLYYDALNWLENQKKSDEFKISDRLIYPIKIEEK
jgi:uncharacterized protein YceK